MIIHHYLPLAQLLEEAQRVHVSFTGEFGPHTTTPRQLTSEVGKGGSGAGQSRAGPAAGGLWAAASPVPSAARRLAAAAELGSTATARCSTLHPLGRKPASIPCP